mmetsp:Transcript_30024/g.69937  ORF Transcript_30024/g.69937 Transcript_30024/m.69937 type:complete len:360 (+) Transcript_30024:1339-2418(+)
MDLIDYGHKIHPRPTNGRHDTVLSTSDRCHDRCHVWRSELRIQLPQAIHHRREIHLEVDLSNGVQDRSVVNLPSRDRRQDAALRVVYCVHDRGVIHLEVDAPYRLQDRRMINVYSMHGCQYAVCGLSDSQDDWGEVLLDVDAADGVQNGTMIHLDGSDAVQVPHDRIQVNLGGLHSSQQRVPRAGYGGQYGRVIRLLTYSLVYIDQSGVQDLCIPCPHIRCFACLSTHNGDVSRQFLSQGSQIVSHLQHLFQCAVMLLVHALNNIDALMQLTVQVLTSLVQPGQLLQHGTVINLLSLNSSMKVSQGIAHLGANLSSMNSSMESSHFLKHRAMININVDASDCLQHRPMVHICVDATDGI